MTPEVVMYKHASDDEGKLFYEPIPSSCPKGACMNCEKRLGMSRCLLTPAKKPEPWNWWDFFTPKECWGFVQVENPYQGNLSIEEMKALFFLEIEPERWEKWEVVMGKVTYDLLPFISCLFEQNFKAAKELFSPCLGGPVGPRSLLRAPLVRAFIRILRHRDRSLVWELVERINRGGEHLPIQGTELVMSHIAAGLKQKGYPLSQVIGRWQNYVDNLVYDGFDDFKTLELYLKGPGEIGESAAGRAIDKEAKRNRERTIENYPDQYSLGKKLGNLYYQSVLFIEERAKALKFPVYVHGRDGELLYLLLKKRGNINVRYGLTSRKVTTETALTNTTPMEYLRRVVPQEAIHVDTGFSGSIPKWLESIGFKVADIYMMSSNNKSYQIPYCLIDIDKEALRDIVLGEVEHQPQRLQFSRPKGDMVEAPYSTQAGAFWARYFGVEDSIREDRKRFHLEMVVAKAQNKMSEICSLYSDELITESICYEVMSALVELSSIWHQLPNELKRGTCPDGLTAGECLLKWAEGAMVQVHYGRSAWAKKVVRAVEAMDSFMGESTPRTDATFWPVPEEKPAEELP